jgi:hypothetical protein
LQERGLCDLLARRSSLPVRSKGIREKEAPPLLRKLLFTLKEAAEYLGRSEWGVRELIWPVGFRGSCRSGVNGEKEEI